MLRYYLADTETTGPTTDDRVCELAYYELDSNLEIIGEGYSRIDPERKISAAASGVHGIVDADVVDSPTMDEYFSIVDPGAFTGDCVLIAHNVQFDKRYLAPYIENLAAEICTLRLARRVWPEAENHKLPTLMYLLNLPRGESHSAKGDITTTLGLLRLISQETEMDLDQIAAESLKPIFVDVMPFGKHKGRALKSLDKSYLNWLLGLDNLDRDMRWSAEQVLAGAV